MPSSQFSISASRAMATQRVFRFRALAAPQVHVRPSSTTVSLALEVMLEAAKWSCQNMATTSWNGARRALQHVRPPWHELPLRWGTRPGARRVGGVHQQRVGRLLHRRAADRRRTEHLRARTGQPSLLRASRTRSPYAEVRAREEVPQVRVA